MVSEYLDLLIETIVDYLNTFVLPANCILALNIFTVSMYIFKFLKYNYGSRVSPQISFKLATDKTTIIELRYC